MTADARLVYLARHGETEWNALGRWQGHTDVPLHAVGHEQARALGERARALGVAAVASSDLARARDTARAVAAALGVSPAYVDADLRERAFGRFEGLTRAECQARFPEAWALYARDPRVAPPDGEPQTALVARARRAVLRASGELAAPAMLVTHGGTIRALVADVTGEAAPHVANGEVHRVVVERGVLVAIARVP